MKKVPHPGSACCDLDQDLAGWLTRETERASAQRAQATEVRAQANAADQRALDLAVSGSADWKTQTEAENARRVLHGEANALMQSVMITEGHAERVRAAHTWRL